MHNSKALPVLDRPAVRPRCALRRGRVLDAGREAGEEGGAEWGGVEESVSARRGGGS